MRRLPPRRRLLPSRLSRFSYACRSRYFVADVFADMMPRRHDFAASRGAPRRRLLRRFDGRQRVDTLILLANNITSRRRRVAWR